VKQFTSTYAYGLRIGDLTGDASDNEDLYHGKELTGAHGLDWYHYGARFYDVARAQWTTMDPADEFHSPYVYVGGDPVNLLDPDGRQTAAARYNNNREEQLLEGGESARRQYVEDNRKMRPYAQMVMDFVPGGALMNFVVDRLEGEPIDARDIFLGAVSPVGKLGRQADDFVDLASPKRGNHILYGDNSGGGHKFRIENDKGKFPEGRSDDQIMHYVSDIATDPSLKWKRSEPDSKPSVFGKYYYQSGRPRRFTAEGVRDGVGIKVVVEPAGEGIITAYPKD